MIKKRDISWWGVIVIFMIILFYTFTLFPFNPLSWDVFGYYLYLPQTFIHNDIGIENLEHVQKALDKYHASPSFYQATYFSETGRYLIRYPIGTAITYSPFFFVGHFFASIFGYPMDGFSAPYLYSFIAGSLFFTLLGLFVLRAILKRFFDQKTVLLVLIIIGLGTNYFHLNSSTLGMAHIALFTLNGLIILFTIKWHESPSIVNSLALSFFIGLACLTRPTDIVILLIPLFWGVKSIKSIPSHFKQIISTRFFSLVLIGFVIGLMALPQFFYWKFAANEYILDSYNNAAEGLDLASPNPLNVLFSFRKGWLVYTPVMILGLIGLRYVFKEKRELFIAIMVYILINLWVVSSWSCWWYAASFSQRALVESYPIMAICFGFLLVGIANHQRLRKIVLGSIGFFVCLNLFQTWQMNSGILDPSRMTAAYYFASFGQIKVDEKLKEELLMINRPKSVEGEVFNDEERYISKEIFFDSYENIEDKEKYKLTDKFVKNEQYALQLDSSHIWSPEIQIPYNEITDKDHAWIRVGFWFYSTRPITELKLGIGMMMQHKGENYNYRMLSLHGDGYASNQWYYAKFDYLTPEVRQTGDNFVTHILMQGDGKVYLDDYKIERFTRK